jgi:hypothetical protein
MVPSHSSKVESSSLTQFCQLGKDTDRLSGRGHYVLANVDVAIWGTGAEPASKIETSGELQTSTDVQIFQHIYIRLKTDMD